MSLELQASPSFERARKLSRVITVLLALAQYGLIGVAILISVGTLFLFDSAASLFAEPWTHLSNTPLAAFGLGQRLAAIGTLLLAVVPSVLILFYLRRLFSLFARGQIFTDANIAALKATGFWLVLSVILVAAAQFLFFAIANTKHHDADIALSDLVVGAMIYVAAYVMAEAQRIAADNAGIV